MIAGLLFFLLVLWVTIGRLKCRFQNLKSAIDSVCSELHKYENDEGCTEVTVWKSYPLSDHMIKELAADEGFDYVREVSKYGSVFLIFRRRSASGKGSPRRV